MKKDQLIKPFQDHTREYSQNFLRNSTLITRVIQRTRITHEDTVYDLGAGDGIITKALLPFAKKVIAIEKDEKYALKLTRKFRELENVEVISGDIAEVLFPSNPYKVFANIPFSQTSAIVKQLLDQKYPPVDAYLVLQVEAAKKFAGNLRGKETLFSLIHKPNFDFTIRYRFSQRDFYPVPSVNIVLLHIHKKEKGLFVTADKDLYKAFLEYAFKQRKTTLRLGLDDIFSYQQFKRLSRDLKFSLQATPTDLTFDQWLGLFAYLKTGVDESKRLKLVKQNR